MQTRYKTIALYLGSVIYSTYCKADSDIYNLSLEELQSIQVQVATKTQTNINYAPSTVSYFTKQQIELLGVNTLVELFSHIPGFYPMFNSVEGNESYLITRGHPQKYANTLLVLINGQRLNEDYTGGINYLVRFVSLHNVDRVEVIRGPGSTLYGSNAFNGVINIITTANNYIELSAGSFGQRALNTGLHMESEEVTLGLDAHFYIDNGDEIGNVFDRFELQNKTSDPREVQQIEFSLAAYGVKFNTRFQQSIRDNFYLFRRLRDGVSNIKVSHLLSGLTYERNNDDVSGYTFGVEYTKGQRKSITALSLQGQEPFNEADFLFGEDFTYQSVRALLDGYYKFSSSQQLSAGVEWVQSQIPGGYLRSNYHLFNNLQFLGNVEVFKEPQQRVVLDKTRQINMAYVQLESIWSEHLRTVVGVRRDTYNDVENRTNPRASLLYQLNQHHLFKLIYGEAYRVPSLGDLYDEESGLTVGNRTLNPTTLKATEIVHQFLSKDTTISTSVFSNKIDDIIDFSTDGNNVFLGNVAGNKSTGIEIEWKTKLTENVEFNGSVTHIFSNKTYVAPYQSKAPSKSLVPRTYGMISLFYRLNERWQGSLSVQGRNDVEVIPNRPNNWHLATSIHYNYDENNKFSINIKNLLNSRYETGSIVPLGEKEGRVFSSFEARSRQVSLSYRHRF